MELMEVTSEIADTMTSNVTDLKGTKIFVTVEEALFDVLIVSFQHGSKIFQGALLDVTKKNSPFGIVPPHPWGSSGGGSSVISPSADGTMTVETGSDSVFTEDKGDQFHALKQRRTYFQGTSNEEDQGLLPVPTKSRRQVGRSVRDQSVRMRRLRPRQVLCSHCKAICNEKSENVQIQNMKRGLHSLPVGRGTLVSRENNATENSTGALITSPRSSLVTRSNSTANSTTRHDTAWNSISTDFSEKNENSPETPPAAVNKCSPGVASSPDSPRSRLSPEYQAVTSVDTSARMILRKRKPDQVVNTDSQFVFPKKHRRIETIREKTDDILCPKNGSEVQLRSSNLTKTSPVIKISFATPQGKDTVVEIPARLQSNCPSDQDDDNWSSWERSEANRDASNKAAKKALKKAKKEAQRKMAATICGAVSPAREITPKTKHHKHKVKRKRKHKDSENVGDQFQSCETTRVNGEQGKFCKDEGKYAVKSEADGIPSSDNCSYEDVKEKCLRQKLSISLKRLNAKAYMRCSPKCTNDPDSNSLSGCSSRDSSSGSDVDEDIPNFPKHEPLHEMDKVKPLMMRITAAHNVKRCVLDNGREMTVGDIVWGKIHGFPWWPGKVLSLTVSQRDNGVSANQQAHVSWYGSSTSSYMPCCQLTPFLEDFKMRYNRKKRGPYKEAIRQATLEARQTYHKELSPDISVLL